MKILDLFSGAGGAAMGMHRACPNAEIIGVDIKPQPRYPFTFIQGDALNPPVDARNFDFIWASPPCQHFSKSVTKENRSRHPNLINRTRKLLSTTGVPYIIENVPGAPLRKPIVLCGSSFGLGVRRHRLFESNFPLRGLPCRHSDHAPQYPPAWNRKNKLRFVAISGGWQRLPLAVLQGAMDIDWMTGNELSEAIPPAYSEYILGQIFRVSQ